MKIEVKAGDAFWKNQCTCFQVPSAGCKAEKFTPPPDLGIGELGKLIDLQTVLNAKGIRSANPIASDIRYHEKNTGKTAEVVQHPKTWEPLKLALEAGGRYLDKLNKGTVDNSAMAIHHPARFGGGA